MHRSLSIHLTLRLKRTLFSGIALVAFSLLAASLANAQALTLGEAWSRFLTRSPLVAAEKEKLEMATGRLVQTQAWSNPVLNYSQEGYPAGLADSEYDDQEFLLAAWQEFELGSKRGKRRDLAQLELDAQNSRYEDFLRRMRLEVSKLYVSVFFASRLKDSLDLAFQQYSRIRETHRKRYELGEVSGLAQMKVEAEEMWYLVRLARAERERNATWGELSALIGWESASVPELSLQDSAAVSLPDPSVLIRKALESRPDLESQKLEALAAEAAVEVERASRIPNLNLGGGYKRDFGVNSFFLGVQFPLPLWDRRQGAIDEKLAGSRRQTTLSIWKESWVRQEVERAYAVFSRLLAASRRLDSSLRPKLERTVEITALSYEQGEAGILEYLDALRTRRDALVEQSGLLAEVHYAQLELEAAVGLPLSEVSP